MKGILVVFINKIKG